MLRHLAGVDAVSRGGHDLLGHGQTCRRVVDDRQARVVGPAAVDHVEPVILAEARRLNPLVGRQRDRAVAPAALDLDVADRARAARAQVKTQALGLDAVRLAAVVALVLHGILDRDLFDVGVVALVVTGQYVGRGHIGADPDDPRYISPDRAHPRALLQPPLEARLVLFQRLLQRAHADVILIHIAFAGLVVGG